MTTPCLLSPHRVNLQRTHTRMHARTHNTHTHKRARALTHTHTHTFTLNSSSYTRVSPLQIYPDQTIGVRTIYRSCNFAILLDNSSLCEPESVQKELSCISPFLHCVARCNTVHVHLNALRVPFHCVHARWSHSEG